MEEKTGAFEKITDASEVQGQSGAPETDTGAVEMHDESAAKGGKRLKKGGRKGVRIALIAIGVLAAAYLGLCAWAHFDTKIVPNTYFAGINYGGLTRSEAEAKLAGCIGEARSARLDFVTLAGEEAVASVALGELEVEADVRSIAGTMYYAPRTGSFLRGGAVYLHALFGGMEVSDSSCDEAFRAAAEGVLRALECAPVEFSAEVTESGEVRVTKAKDGRALTANAEESIVSALREAYFGGGYPLRVQLLSLDEDAAGEYEIVPAQTVELAAEREKLVGEKVNASYDIENECIVPSRAGVYFSLEELETAYAAAGAGETFTLAVRAELPEVTTEMLEEGLFRDELSSYTTRVGGAAGRHKNVQLTAERIDGYIINAGDSMQYGPLVTPFTAENGYFPAPGYLKGKTVDMIGGGACQASSTLYAAALYANLEIVQRVNHGYASDYIGLGLDATVAEGGPEFEFRNSTLYPIKVCAEFFTEKGKDYIKITLLGTKTDDSYVKIATEVLETIPYEEEIVETEELAPGEQKVEQTAYTGYRVKTYRKVYAGDGTLLSSAFEATSNYKARNRIILVGKEAAAEIDPTVGELPEEGEIPDGVEETVPVDGDMTDGAEQSAETTTEETAEP